MEESTKLKSVSLLLRVGIASTFLYPAIASFLDPYSWVGFMPRFLRNIFPSAFLLSAFSVFEIIVALWLLWGKKLFYASLLAALTLAAVIFFNLGAMDIVFRDFAILFAALALALLDRRLNN